MAESSLSLAHDELADAVSRFLGYGDDYTDIGATEQGYVDKIVTSGLRRFYRPVPIGGQTHEWSFLKPVQTSVLWADQAVESGVTVLASGAGLILTFTGMTVYPTMIGRTITITDDTSHVITGYTSSTVLTVTTVATAATEKTFSMASGGHFRLPDDFGYLLGRPTFASTEAYYPLDMIGEGQIRQLQQTNATSGKPLYGATQPQTTDGTVGQRWDLMVWPTPGSTFNLTYRYHVLVSTMDASTVVRPYGGAAHSETILESCLAVAEERENDERGLHGAAYMENLAASIEYDKRLGPQTLGYNGESSDRRGAIGIDRVTGITADWL